MAYQCINRSVDRANVLPSGKAGAALAASDLVYRDSSGNWQIAASGAHMAEGIMENAALIYEMVSPIAIGDFDGWSSQTIGAKAYLSTTGTTGNTITATKPVGVQVQEIGFFASASVLRVCVSPASDSIEAGSISVFGSDGKFKASYATIDLAVAALATDDILKIKAGEYALTAAVPITKAGVHIMGIEPGVTIVAAADADYAFKTVLGAIAGTKTVSFSNFTLDHGDDATQVGILIDNASAAARLNVEITDVDFESDGGQSIDIDHTVTTAAIRVYVDGCLTEGPVGFTPGHDEDRLRFENGILRGGMVIGTASKDAEILLRNSTILHEGITGGESNQRLFAVYCISETDANPNVYAVVDSSDLADSCTDVIIQGTAS